MPKAPSLPAAGIDRIAAGNLTSDLDLTLAELNAVLSLAAEVKKQPAQYANALAGHCASLLFEKPSLRTRLTFEVAMKQLGGGSVLSTGPIGGREPVKDVARNLERWTQMIVARTFSQQTVEELAAWASVPVINALSDRFHPCQALADMLTLKERWGEWKGRKLAYVGDGNNVAHSLLLTCSRLGIDCVIVTPPGFEPEETIVAQARRFATDSAIAVTNDAAEGLDGADAVYTDVWASMGQEQEAAERARMFAAYQVNAALFALARADALFLHCLPAHRDEEVTDDVIELPRSAVFDQAENRLHAQKALLLMLAKGDPR
jgi:ornithine carbamoyltransferase